MNKTHRSWDKEIIPLSNQVIPVLKFGNRTASSSFQSNQCWGQKRLRRNYHPKILGDRISERDSKGRDEIFVKITNTKFLRRSILWDSNRTNQAWSPRIHAAMQQPNLSQARSVRSDRPARSLRSDRAWFVRFESQRILLRKNLV